MYVNLRYDLELGFQGQISKTPYVVVVNRESDASGSMRFKFVT